MVQSSLNGLNKTIKKSKKNKLNALLIKKKKFFFEELQLIQLKYF